jgi:hypothetical protein
MGDDSSISFKDFDVDGDGAVMMVPENLLACSK